MLANWDAELPKFIKVMPHDYKRALAEMAAAGNGHVVYQDEHPSSTGGEGFVIAEDEDPEPAGTAAKP